MILGEIMMKKIVLYGAGVRGQKIAKMMVEKEIELAGFLDSYKAGQTVEVDGLHGVKKFEIFSLDQIEKNKDEYKIIITIADYEETSKIKKTLKDIEVTTIENVLYSKTSDEMHNRMYVIDYHTNEMEEWYDAAENVLGVFWDKGSTFLSMFTSLDLDNVVELACGHGRHVARYEQSANKITLVDVVDKNISYCKKRFSDKHKISFYTNNGYDLSELESNTYTALFTYDSMVHFEMMDIFGYLKETKRILKSGGRALFHHSNNTEDYRITFSTGSCGRNYMSKQLFAYLVNRAGLKVLEQKLIDWSGHKALDCLTLVEKSGI